MIRNSYHSVVIPAVLHILNFEAQLLKTDDFFLCSKQGTDNIRVIFSNITGVPHTFFFFVLYISLCNNEI